MTLTLLLALMVDGDGVRVEGRTDVSAVAVRVLDHVEGAVVVLGVSNCCWCATSITWY